MTKRTTTKFTAMVEWDGRDWVAVPVGGGITQARRLDQLPSRVAEVIHLMTGREVQPEDVELEIHYAEDLGQRATDLRDRRAHLEASEKELAAQTAATARVLRKRGMSLRDIGTLTGVSYQRVHQLVG